ncbi:unnamed protein product [Rhodiola kirilowii]
MSEIVVADPIVCEGGESSGTRDDSDSLAPEPFDSERLPVTLAPEIRKFLRVANMIEADEPRIAYLCRFHSFEIAHMMDRNSSGRGVRQFKTSLLQRLEQDEVSTISRRKEKSDLRELRRVFREYKDRITKHGRGSNGDNGYLRNLMYARQIASVLFEVLNTVTDAAGPQALANKDRSHGRPKLFVPYNILPLDPGNADQPIVRLPEVKAAVVALGNTRGLHVAEDCHKQTAFDLFDWLQHCFGFQEGNITNQREHLILLLANIHIRQARNQKSLQELGEKVVDELMKKFFKNYSHWCKFLGRTSNIRLPYVKQEAQQHKLLYIGLYLLIWGEAANLRFMPECLCYVFHHMAYELHGLLTYAISKTTYGGGYESFLNNVVTPIYRVLDEEAQKSKGGTADHSTWRNYDDLNEFFWSIGCFQIGWPMQLNHSFFCTRTDANENKIEEEDHQPVWLGKTNFVEIRSFWQIFRSFDRLYVLLILSLQVLVIIACYDLRSPLQVFEVLIFEDIMSIFITSALLKLILGILDICFTWKARNTIDILEKRKQLLKLCLAVMWTIVLPVCYAKSRRKYTCSSSRYGTWLDNWCINSYMVAVGLYLLTNSVDMVLFFIPAINKYIEISNYRICAIMFWWTQPRLYIGRGMQESQVSLFKYTVFWIVVLSSKFLFSYHFEIKPLIEPTRLIMKVRANENDLHEMFPKVKNNAGAIVAVWAPVVVVYFMDTQIWYSVYCSIVGGITGVTHHLGEIRTLSMLRLTFHSLPSALNAHLNPRASRKHHEGGHKNILLKRFKKISHDEKSVIYKFAYIWNQILESLRSEDLLSNREMDLMTIHLGLELVQDMVCWPVFLLADKLWTALNIAKDFEGNDEVLFKKIKKDRDMYCAVTECYELLKHVLDILVVDDFEKAIVSAIWEAVEESIKQSTLLEDFKMSELHTLQAKCSDLLDLLIKGNKNHRNRVVKVLQDIFELVIHDMMTDNSRILELLHSFQPVEELDEKTIHFSRPIEPQLFESIDGKHSVHFPLVDDTVLHAQIKRFFLLLTVKDTAIETPTNLEARRRILFFATSLFMKMPNAPKVRNMMSFSLITPHYLEDINFSLQELHSSKEQVSILFYMQQIYPDEWKNFLERISCENMDRISAEGKDEELRNWASFRGQTLSRTVRGMMYYKKALKLQAYLDMLEDEGLLLVHLCFINSAKTHLMSCIQFAMVNLCRVTETPEAKLDALADMKFTHVVSCQMYGSHKASGDPRAQDILDLMNGYPSLRVAYVEEKEEKINAGIVKVYSSILLKGVNGFDQEIYRIKLPGPPFIGEGKPENQNHSIIFTRGEALQTIDMNQDNYLEEAIKMRNVLQEFHKSWPRKSPTVLGLREHIFTGSVSTLAWFMSYQETSFVTIGQRILANPLRVRFHYGHPDIFDRLFHITRGGISKASKTINLSEDVFAGFNSTLRRGHITYHEYLQIGKGRDVGLNQISKFEAKIANGNSEQTISRDIYRLARQFDFFRMLSCYFTTIGSYFSSLISIIGIYVFLYGQLYLVLSGLQDALYKEAGLQNIKSLETALASQSFIQLGLLTGLPMVMEIVLEKGFLIAVKDFILMQLQLASVFFTFSLGTKIHHYGRTILHGGAKYRPTGRKVVVFHASFTENYRLYSRSHFVKGFELLLLLIVYDLFRRSSQSSVAYVLITYSIWFMSITWLFAPFFFNPLGFDWGKIVDDWKDWNKWIKQQGGIGVQQDKSWQSWWIEEQAHLGSSGLGARFVEIVLSVRFFLYQYGIVYHLDISHDHKNVLVYAVSWGAILFIFILVKAVNWGSNRFSANHHLLFRALKTLLFLGVVGAMITLAILSAFSLKDLILCCIAFIPTGWGLILVAQAARPIIQKTGLWSFTRVLVRAYDYGMGVALFGPIAVLAWLPIISAFQTRFLFNEAFNRHLQIQPILTGKRKHK